MANDKLSKQDIELLQAWMKENGITPQSKKPLKLEIAWRCTDERFIGASLDTYMKDKEPKTPEVVKVGGGAYLSVTWAITPENALDGEILLRPVMALSLN